MEMAERIMEDHPDSALSILHHLKSEKYKSSADRALYGLLLFRALDKKDKPLQPDSLIDFSINYFRSKNDNRHLAACYYYKGHKCKRSQHYDEAAELELKALECLQENQDNVLLGKINSDIGDICAMQRDYKESIRRYHASVDYFNRAGKTIEAKFVILSIGRMYNFLGNYKTAKWYFSKVTSQLKDSLLCGSAYLEIGSNYYAAKQLDSAQYYLRKSLRYPYKGTNYAIRYYILSDLLFDLGQYDSSSQCALIALKYPATFYTRRECYRLLVNIEYIRKDIKQMGGYMTHYQYYCDSIRKVELQTKCTVLEKIHNTTEEVNGTRRNMILIVSGLLVITFLCICFIYFLYKRNKLKNEQLDGYKKQLNSKQEFVSQSLSKKIEEARTLQTKMRKMASADERLKLDKELYTNTLNLDNWDNFNREMNHAFNNIIITLQSDYPAITRKEIIWCCLHLLDIPHADRMLLLDTTSDSLYKLKQRLAQKLNLKTTRCLDLYLKEITEIKD